MKWVDRPLTHVVAIAFVVSLMSQSALAADEKPKKKDSAQAKVWVIRATKTNTTISKELNSIKDQLKKSYPYTGFKVEKTFNAEVNKTTKTIALPADCQLKVTLDKRDNKRIFIEIEIQEKKNGKWSRKLKTKLGINVDKTALLGGWSWGKTKDAMILAVSAK